MNNKLISIGAVLFLLLITIVSVEAKTIIKINDDAAVEKNQQADHVIAVNGQATISGLVEKNVVVIGGSVVLTGGAVVRGNVFCIGGVVVKSVTTQVFGEITEINSASIPGAFNDALGARDGSSWILTFISISFFIFIIICALLMTLLIPQPIIRISATIKDKKSLSFFWGIIGMTLTGLIAMLLAVSIAGIPLIPLELGLAALILAMGFISVGSLGGRYFLVKILKSKEPGMVKAALSGLALLWLIGEVPYIGGAIKAFFAIMGFGGVLLALFTRKKTPPALG